MILNDIIILIPVFSVVGFSFSHRIAPSRFAGVDRDMSSGGGATNPLGDGPMDPREFEKKTQDELDDILNRCVRVSVSRLVEFSMYEYVEIAKDVVSLHGMTRLSAWMCSV